MSESLSPELRALLALHLVPGLGPMRTAALLERFGSAAAVLQASPAELTEVPHVGPKLAGDLHAAAGRNDVDAELGRMAKHGARVLALGTPEYPESLATIPDPPHIVYVRGTLEARSPM
jgi:DNA processing protein